ATDAELVFSSDQPAATFECSLDAAPFAACSSPADYSGLALGAHDFQVRARNGAYTDATPADYTWSIVQNVLSNGSFETGDFTGWTIVEDSGQPDWGTWGVVASGTTINPGDSVYDYASQMSITETSPGLPITYTATDGNDVALLLVNGPELHRM